MQELTQVDYLRKSLFCLQIRKKCNEDTTFIKQLLFMNEAMFTRDGIFNIHMWAVENLHKIAIFSEIVFYKRMNRYIRQ